MRASRTSTESRWWRRLGAAWCTLAVAEMIGQALRGIVHPEHGDLVAFLTGARLVGSDPSCVYCPGAQTAAQTAVLGRASDIGTNPFVNPPLAAWLLQPLGTLPLRLAMAVFTTLSLAALGVAATLLRRALPREWPGSRRTMVTVVTVALLPAGTILAYGQWTLLLLAPAAAAALLLRRGDRVGAGLLLAVLLVKPQLIWLVVPTLLVVGARRALAGFGIGAAAWAASGLLIAGPGAMADWAHIVLAAHVGEVGKTAGLPGLAAAAGLGETAAFALSVALAAVALLGLWTLRDRLRGDLPLACGLGIALSALCSPHVFAGDLTLLAVPLALLAARTPAPALTASACLGMAWLVDQQLGGGLPRLETLAALAITAWVAVAVSGPTLRPARMKSLPAALTRL